MAGSWQVVLVRFRSTAHIELLALQGVIEKLREKVGACCVENAMH